VFQEDIYPDTMSGIPSLSCEEWVSGVNKEPILMSLKDGAVPFMPKIVTYKQLGFSELGNNLSRSYLSNKTNKQTNGSASSKENCLLSSCSSSGGGYQESNSLCDVVRKQHNSWSASSQANSSHEPIPILNDINKQRTTPQYNHHPANTKLVLSSKSAFSKRSKAFCDTLK
jgi:hypothetical protein